MEHSDGSTYGDTVVLIVDDNEDDVTMYKHYLSRDRSSRYEFRHVTTGSEALEELAAANVDCVLLDYVLPDIDGLEFLNRKAVRAGIRDVPVVFSTGFGNEMTAVEALKRGAVDYLVKDRLSEDVLSRSVRYAMQRSRDLQLHREHALFLETLVETIPSPLFYKDRHGHYRGCNKAFADYFGWNQWEVVGKSDREILPEELAERFAAQGLDSQGEGEERSFEISFTARDGENRHVIVSHAVYSNVEGEPEGSVGVIMDITARKRAEEQIRYLALYDELTGLPNRRLFFERMHQALIRAGRNQQVVGFLYVDLDGFKPINDEYGHEAGDAALREIGKRLPTLIRDSDTAARIGGDEFAVILPDLPDERGIELVAQKIADSIGQPLQVMGDELHVHASVGISSYPQDGMDVDKLLNQADAAMYVAKRRGARASRNRPNEPKE